MTDGAGDRSAADPPRSERPHPPGRGEARPTTGPPSAPPHRSRLVVLAGPTAVGKGTVTEEVRRRHPEVWISVSATTRRPRPGEIDGRHYHFLTDEAFADLREAGDLLEYAWVHRQAWYGTPRGPVEEQLRHGRPALLEVDIQGARQVRQAMPDALLVFLMPPSWDELVRRLVGRGTETRAEQRERLATAREELAAAKEFDVLIENDDVHRATEELVSLMTSHIGSR